MHDTAEHRRLEQHKARSADWKRWGPYLSERAWGTVREDYTAGGDVWDAVTHDIARSRAYRWNEDGLAGICDRHQYVCFALALWNGRDPFLKERLFGLTGPQGNHGEDVKELYYYLDATPTSSWLKMLYKYPQAPFPYEELVRVNAGRSVEEPEYELADTGVFDDGRYFDVVVEYAKRAPNDLCIRITVSNRGPEAAPLWLLPTLWFRNTWSWGYPHGPMGDVQGTPRMKVSGSNGAVHVDHPAAGTFHWYARDPDELLFTDNVTHQESLHGESNPSPWVKDAFHRYVVGSEAESVNPEAVGTKAAALYRAEIPAGSSRQFALRLVDTPQDDPFGAFDATCAAARDEADAFYAAIQDPSLSADERNVQRQALAGMLWSKQLYYYDISQWLDGDPVHPPPRSRLRGRNAGWRHLTNFDPISMPDKWEYPWYASWDLAFHCIPLSLVDVEFAKRQLELMTREWYMHPNGQVPAYEWSLEDVNPPVHAWAAWRVYKICQRRWSCEDRAFLRTVFHKLLLNFTWWVNRKDIEGDNIFQGGFLGLDNIGLFDRSRDLPGGGHIDQSDATAWMAAYCLQMMRIALELAKDDGVYQDLAGKFFEHFLRVAHAMTHVGHGDETLWDEEDGFFYDVLHLPDGGVHKMRVRSLVGLLPLIAVETLDPQELSNVPLFRKRMEWFVKHRPHLASYMASVFREGVGQRRLFALLSEERLVRILRRMLDEEEFLSPYGIRSLSRQHRDHPVELVIDGQTHVVRYEPGEAEGSMFGGNSNWRGPVWFPTNHLLIEALQRHHHYYGDDLKVECPTGSGQWKTLGEVAVEISCRLMSLFLRDGNGRRPVYGDVELFQTDPHFRDLVLFHEYFHGESGIGLGASHQTGWTGLVAKLLQQSGGTSGCPES